MKRVLTALVLVPVVVLLIFRAPLWAITVVVAVVALLACHEYLRLLDAYGLEPFGALLFVVATVVFLPGTVRFTDERAGVALNLVTSLLLALFVFLVLSAALRREDLRVAFLSAACTAMALPYIVLPLVYLKNLPATPDGRLLTMVLLIIVWVGDTFAFYAGRLFGRHKLAPRVSPGKTWEGTIVSLVGATALGAALLANLDDAAGWLSQVGLMRAESALYDQPFVAPYNWAVAAAIAAAINIAAQFGDLVESLIKRGAGVKDSGALLPGHGGVLDRVDALLFAAPVGFIAYSIANQFRQ